MGSQFKFLAPALAVALSGVAAGQGEDCSTATTIAGLGSFAFDTTTAVTEGFDGGGTCVGGDNVVSDFFYQWTVPAAGDYEFDTEGSSFDTQLSIHTGTGCAAVCLEHDDDAGTGLLSNIKLFGLAAGQTYLIQVGGFPGATPTGFGSLNIDTYVDPCTVAIDDNLEENDTCLTAGSLTAGSYPGLFVSTVDGDFYAINVPAGNILTVDCVDGLSNAGDVDLRLYDSSCTLIEDFNTDGFDYAVGAAGGTYIVEIYADPTSVDLCSEYDMDVSLNVDPCFNAVDDSLEENDDCGMEVNLASGTYTNLFVSKTDWDYFKVNVNDGDTLQIDMFFLHDLGDTDIFLYEEGACADFASGNVGTTGSLVSGFSASDDEQIVWTNSTGINQTYIVKINVYPPTSTGDCNNYDMIVSGADGQGPDLGDPYCGPNTPNTTGLPGLLSASGNISATANDFTLTGTQLPDGEFCFFIASRTQGFIANPNSSQGNLCVIGNIARFNGAGQLGQTSGGQFSFQVPLDAVPEPPGLNTTVMAGETWNFQLWHRDFLASGPTSNFTEGLEVTFQ